MAHVRFTENLRRHVECPPQRAHGATVAEVLSAVFRGNQRLQGYVLDDHGRPRKHIMIFVDGEPMADRRDMSDVVSDESEIYVMQALSGG